MSILYLLVPLALLLASAGVGAFFWAVRSGQFDDVETPALRILMEEDTATGRTPRQRVTRSDQPATP